METRRISLGSPLPATPKQPGGTYLDLLKSFGSRSSATSVTQLRRTSSFASPTQERRSLPTRTNTMSGTANINSEQPPDSAPPMSPESPESPEPLSGMAPESSEDELATDTGAGQVAHHQTEKSRTRIVEELKMETRRKERDEQPRRSLRSRKSDILSSDTQPMDELAMSPSKKKAPPRPKLDTARQRLRDDIAHRTKVKADNFLVANKDFFLPLLPEHNYVTKLVENSNAQPIVEYEELSEQPTGVTATMKPYQLSGLSFLVHLYNNGFSGILGDEMGLGKTLQTLSLFQYLEEQDRMSGISSEEPRPYLVICPLSVLNSWVSEAEKWVPELPVLRFHGTVNERAHLKQVAFGLIDRYGNETDHAKDRRDSRKSGVKTSNSTTKNHGANSYKVFVTTYEAFQAEAAWFKHSFIWRYVVLDEGHKIKNNVSGISHALMSISSEFRLILTGTPLQNNLVEMWALLAWLYPDVFTKNTATLFKESFHLSRGKVRPKTMDDARHLLELIMLRRMKDSPGVNLGLPPKEEIILYVPLSPLQKLWYTRLITGAGESLLNDLFTNVQDKEKAAMEQDKEQHLLLEKLERLTQGNDDEITDAADELQETADMVQAIQKDTSSGAWRRLMNLVTHLRMCCSHPYLIDDAVPSPYYLGDHVIRASGKFVVLEKLLRNQIFEQKKKVILFAGFTTTLDCCEDLLTLMNNNGKDFKYLRLDGKTKRPRRNLNIRLFNDPNSDYKVILVSTRAGGLGITLTAAEDVIFLDEDWNPQITLQAEARAHRIGQTKKVTIYKLLSQGTVEEQMMGRIRKKLYLSTKITESMQNVHGTPSKKNANSSSEQDMPQMSMTQLKSLVRRGAQTLSHPDINVAEMLSWDFPTMLEKCRDGPLDNTGADAPADVDEEKWLSVMERVECAVLDGKRYQRQPVVQTPTEEEPLNRQDRRKGKNVTVMVDGYMVSKASVNCAAWEAVPTLAGKDPRLADPKREKAREYEHENHCLICFDNDGKLLGCKGCPRSYCEGCLSTGIHDKFKAQGFFHCLQHECFNCGKKTTDAEGLIYRCRWCEHGFCEDCLDWDRTDLLGDNLPEFEMLNNDASQNAFYIKCSDCKEHSDLERREWLAGVEADYEEQHEVYLQKREKARKALELESDRKLDRKNNASNREGELFSEHGDTEFAPHGYYDAPSPPGLTDTSLATPLPGSSGFSTPPFGPARHADGMKRKTGPVFEGFILDAQGEKSGKKMRLDDPFYDSSNDASMQGFSDERRGSGAMYTSDRKQKKKQQSGFSRGRL